MTTRKFNCSQCSYTTRNMDKLKNHLINMHNKEQYNWMVDEIEAEFICDDCEIVFPSRSLLSSHLDSVHSGDRGNIQLVKHVTFKKDDTDTSMESKEEKIDNPFTKEHPQREVNLKYVLNEVKNLKIAKTNATKSMLLKRDTINDVNIRYEPNSALYLVLKEEITQFKPGHILESRDKQVVAEVESVTEQKELAGNNPVTVLKCKVTMKDNNFESQVALNLYHTAQGVHLQGGRRVGQVTSCSLLASLFEDFAKNIATTQEKRIKNIKSALISIDLRKKAANQCKPPKKQKSSKVEKEKGREIYLCDLCDYNSVVKGMMKRHKLVTHHAPVKPHVEERVGKQQITNQVPVSPIECLKCFKFSCNEEIELEQHNKEHHLLPGSGQQLLPVHGHQSLPGPVQLPPPSPGKQLRPGTGHQVLPGSSQQPLPGPGQQLPPGPDQQEIKTHIKQVQQHLQNQVQQFFGTEKLPGPGQKFLPGPVQQLLPGLLLPNPGLQKLSSPGQQQPLQQGQQELLQPGQQELQQLGQQQILNSGQDQMVSAKETISSLQNKVERLEIEVTNLTADLDFEKEDKNIAIKTVNKLVNEKKSMETEYKKSIEAIKTQQRDLEEKGEKVKVLEGLLKLEEEKNKQPKSITKEADWSTVKDVRVEEVWNDEGGQLVKRLEIEERQTYLACKKCDKVLQNDNAMRVHMREHTRLNNQIINCHYCDFISNDAEVLISHIADTHSSKFTCKTCKNEFNTNQEMLEHVDLTHGFVYTQGTQQPSTAQQTPLFPCGFCPDAFLTQIDFTKHTQEKHTRHTWQESNAPSTALECYDCGHKSDTKIQLMEHKRQVHYKKKLCVYWHGNGRGCRFPSKQCVNIHEENITPTEHTDHRKRIECRNGSSCNFHSTDSCLYKHAEIVTRAAPESAQSTVPRVEVMAPNRDGMANFMEIIMKLNQNVENISERINSLELKSMTDFPPLGSVQGRN